MSEQSEIKLSTEETRSVTDFLTSVSKPAKQIYSELGIGGFTAVVGATLAFAPLFPNFFAKISDQAQVAYVVSGTFLMFISAAWITIFNCLQLRSEKNSQDFTLKTLELKLKARTNIHDSAQKGVTETDVTPPQKTQLTTK